MKKKIAFYMCGNFARVLRHCTEYLEEFELHAFCPNKKAYDICMQDGRFQKVEYLFESLNDVFNSISEDELAKTYPEINISRVLFVDKSHYKKYPGKYQLKVINAMGMVMESWFNKIKPDYLLIPIIESVDAMLACEMAKLCNCTPMVYTHARHLHVSFFSHSANEILPMFVNEVESSDAIAKKSLEFIDEFHKNPVPLKYDYTESNLSEIHDDIKIQSALQRLVCNVRLKLGFEKHNQSLRLWIKFQVFLQRFLIPLHRFKYYLTQKLIIETLGEELAEFDYFPLHFSPESSINTPAPFYIDQERVVDQILLTREGNRPLILKEHPAVAGYRPLSFYRTMRRKPFVVFSPIERSSIELVLRATTTYSVTGTACLEAFLLSKNFKQFGENMLSAWCDYQEKKGLDKTPWKFVEDVFKISGDYVLSSPKTNHSQNTNLFCKKNISALCTNIQFYIEQNELYKKKHND